MIARLHPGHAVLALLAALAAVLGFVALKAVRKPMPMPPPFVAPPMADRALLQSADPFFPGQPASGDSLPVTSLPLSLHGLRMDAASGRGSAIIAAADGLQLVHPVGASISSGVVLVAIARDHVVLDNGGRRETLWLDNGSRAPVQRFDPGPGAASGLSATAANDQVITMPPPEPMGMEATPTGPPPVPQDPAAEPR